MQRQITMQKPNAPLLQAFNTQNGFIPVNNALLTTTSPWSSGGMWYHQDRLDLRGLLAGKENGVLLNNIVLQESLPFFTKDNNDLTEGNTVWVCDLITTFEPTEGEIAQYFRGTDQTNIFPGFIRGNVNISGTALDVEPGNPNQVIWGLWRLFCLDSTTKVTDTLFRNKLVDSGYFGEGDPIVSPRVYWTRVIWSLNSKLSSVQGGKGVCVPSSNLVMQGVTLDMTTPQEITQMMRASGR